MERENGSDEMILVPRAELLAWAQDWLRENDPGDGTDCVTPFDWHLLKTPVKAHCTTCSCVSGMTPAIRFDATPAEKEGAVRDHLIRMGWTPPAEAQPRGRGCGDHDHASYIPGCGLCAATLPEKRMAAPPSAATPLSREHGSVQEMFNPSAPVGVEAIIVDMERWIRAVEASGPYAAGRTVVVQEWVKQLRALAQQPAATLPDEDDSDLTVAYMAGLHDGRKEAQQPAAAGEMGELVGLLDEVRSHFTRDDDLPDDLLPRIDAALAAQPGGSDNDR